MFSVFVGRLLKGENLLNLIIAQEATSEEGNQYHEAGDNET